MKEVWKKIKGFEKYEVSSLGKIKSNQKIKPFFMKTSYLIKGYPGVMLTKDGKGYLKYIHRLVAQSFIPNPDNKITVNHKDGNKLNNKVDNLEWMTYSENNYHASETGLNKSWQVGEKSPFWKKDLKKHRNTDKRRIRKIDRKI